MDMTARAGFNGHKEIAHAIVLPPPPDDQSLVRVLFMNRSACALYAGTGGTGNHSYIWELTDPGVVTRMFGPNLGYQGTTDPFCSGHALDADGGVIVAGGLNYVAKCESTASCITQGQGVPDLNLQVGHRAIFRLDTSVDPPEWMADEVWPALLEREHWYPTVTTMDNGALKITGHSGAPSPDCEIPGWPYGSEPATSFFHEFLVPETGQVDIARNWMRIAECAEGDEISTGTYPRMHLAAAGVSVHIDGKNRVVVGGVPTDQHVTRMMNLIDPPCQQGLRWEESTGDTWPVFRHGVNSVHFVLLDDESSTGTRDVFYVFGGVDGEDADPCPAASTITNAVRRLKVQGTADAGLPSSLLAADWVTVSPMNHPRVNANAVLMPTGDVILMGGEDDDCQPVLASEVFRPVEIFGGSDAGVWKLRDEQDHPRTYHSVAGLLPDGRPFSAGGDESHSYYTMEIFAPAWYARGERPIILSAPDPDPAATDAIEYGKSFDMEVRLQCEEAEIERIVLLRSTASTHGVDMNQRYVELAFDVTGGEFPDFTVDVQSPNSGYAAPPGWYHLFVVDSNGLPSHGKWVRVAPPQVQ